MSVGITIACFPMLESLLLVLLNFFATFVPKRQTEPESTRTDRPECDYTRRFNLATIFRRPKPAYLRSNSDYDPIQGNSRFLERYHDPGSNVTFDLYRSAPPRLPRTWESHTRTPNRASSLTNFSLPFSVDQRDHSYSAVRSSRASFGTGEFIGMDLSDIGSGIGYAVSITSGDTVSEEINQDRQSLDGKDDIPPVPKMKDFANDMPGIVRTTTTYITV
ncbi:hypothetical protein BU24DRAFT_422721, partial [Aaosphaeria arxii CBS 175.79]